MTTSTGTMRATALRCAVKIRRVAAAMLGLVTLAAVSFSPAAAQKSYATPEVRITGAVSNGVRATLAGSRPARAVNAADAGRMAAGTLIQGATIFLGRSATQQAALDALILAQQDASSPAYHQWLTPDQFAAQFGASDADLAKVTSWLEQQGMQAVSVSRNRSEISFTGSVAQIEAAFSTEMHYVTSNNEKHFAPNSELSVPAAFAGVVQAVSHVSDFRPKSHMRPRPAFTSSQSGSYFLQPGDVAAIYDINPAYNAGYTGSGQTIAIAGQSAILTSDITNFQDAAGLPVKNPTLLLMPNTGTSEVYANDESESDLDVEYSGSIAKGAAIIFVYTGNSPNYGTFDAMAYAITNRTASIVSVSYGECEPDLGTTGYAQYNASLQQAAAQGQTVIAAAGDEGSTDCYGDGSALQTALTVDFPSSSQYVTGLGGTEFLTADLTSTYFTQASGSDVITSAKGYIPEMVWNDDNGSPATPSIGAGSGGVSIITPRPSWQAGVTGIPSGSYRTTPDISLDSALDNAPYLYCSSDPSVGVTGSCSNGFRNSTNTTLTAAGGTSFAAPIFAGMVAILNQKTGATNGQGLINPTLYKLAGNAATYSSAFHDITIGNNGCILNQSYIIGTYTNGSYEYGPACPASSAGVYAATTGYDLATGLGSIDFYNLMNAWTPAVVKLATSTTPAVSGTADVISITVTSGVAPAPTGTVLVSLDNGIPTSVTLTPGTTSSTASYTIAATTAIGTHTLGVSYQGDANYLASSGGLAVIVASPGTFTISAPALTLAAGATGAEVVTLTSTGGFLGAVNVSLSSNISNTCYVAASGTLTAGSTTTVSLPIYTNSVNCPGTAQSLLRSGVKVSALTPAPATGREVPTGILLAGLLGLGFKGRRSRKLRGVIAVAILAVAGLAISGCGSSDSTSQGILTTGLKGTYTVTVSATDAATGSKMASSTFTLTLD